ncbi:MAG TPA: hypothetical protein G4N96_08935 [Chloroflexi bacterium]|nr:hypothetical protein [Chloroflexota bacterium]
MNTREFQHLLIGMALIIGAFIGFTMLMSHPLAGAAGQSWYAFDFYADHHHPAPTSTPSPPTPTPTPTPIFAQTTMDAGGGTFTPLTTEPVTIHFPPGAVTTDTLIGYTRHLEGEPGRLSGADRYFALTASQQGQPLTQFERPISLTIALPPDHTLISSTLGLYWLQGTAWITKGISVTDRSRTSLSAELDHFTEFAVLGRTNRIYLPLTLKDYPRPFYMLNQLRKLTACENMGNHHLYIQVKDAAGEGINDIPVEIRWGAGAGDNIIAKTKTDINYDGNVQEGIVVFTMFKGTYAVSILDGDGQVGSGITADYQVDEYCGEALGNSLYHASFELIFQQGN